LMRPRVLAVNFVHGWSEREARDQLEWLSRCIAESSRWRGEGDPFLEYELVDIVDCTGPPGKRDRNSAQFPRTANRVNFDYAALHERLSLADLVNAGEINEVWIIADHTDHSAPWETVEVKQGYDEAFRPVDRVEFYAGNSGGHEAPWIGRSLRILFVN